MKRTFVRLLLLSLTYAASHPVTAGPIIPLFAGSPAFEGKVLDAATGKPLAGVFILATWHDFTPWSYTHDTSQDAGWTHCSQMINALNTVSGADGGYAFPAWSGKRGRCWYMAKGEPTLTLFKPGYEVAVYTSKGAGQSYKVGPDVSIPMWGGTTLKMQPLGFHYYDGSQDSHVAALMNYAISLSDALAGQDSCYWEVVKPALTMTLQEQRRLVRYGSDKLDLRLDDPQFLERVFGPRCVPAGALEALERQAAAIAPDAPILPYVQAPDRHNPGFMEGALSAGPDDLHDQILKEQAAGSADDGKSIMYHAKLDPANPYYLMMVRIATPVGTGPDQSYQSIADGRGLFHEGIYGYVCGTYAGLSPDRPPSQHIGLDHACTWVTALGPKSQVGRDVYDAEHGAWLLTGHSLVRPAGESSPALIEIHAPASSEVTTTLEAAGPNRWRLPPAGQHFSLSIAASGQADAQQGLVVDNVSISGNTDILSTADIHDLVLACQFRIVGGPSSVVILSKDDAHCYMPSRAEGWMTVKRGPGMQATSSKRLDWQVTAQGLPQYSAAMDLINTANQVYVFSFPLRDDPQWDEKQLRLLDEPARQKLVALLGAEKGWNKGVLTEVPSAKGTRYVGFVFRDGKHELDLFFTTSVIIEGALDGEFVVGTLQSGARDDLNDWITRHAQPLLQSH